MRITATKIDDKIVWSFEEMTFDEVFPIGQKVRF